MVHARVLELKDKYRAAVRSRVCGVLLLALWSLPAFGAIVTALARAQPLSSVLVLEDSAAPHPQLIAALRIELSDHRELRVQVRPAGAGLDERMRVAHELAQEAGVAAVVWVEPGTPRTAERRATTEHAEQGTALVYVVGRRAGRALLEIVRIPANERPDADRVVALKLGELLRELLDRRGASEVLQLAEVPQVLSETVVDARSPNTSAPESEHANGEHTEHTDAAAQWTWRGAFELGPRLKAALDAPLTRVGLGGSLRGLAWWESYGIGVTLGLDAYPSVERVASAANSRFELTASELAPLVRCDLALRLRPFTLSARVGGALEFIAVSGRDITGTTQELSVLSLGGSLGVALERELWGGLAIAAFVDLRYNAQRHEFYIQGVRALDLGNLQLIAGLNLQLYLPLSAAR
jgi:hypothetical protein